MKSRKDEFYIVTRIVILYTILWFVNLFNGTGLDYVYHVTDIAKYVVIGGSIICICINRGVNITKREFMIYFGMVCVFASVSYLKGYGLMGVKYLWVFCLVYLLSNMQVEYCSIRWIGFLYGVLGILILVLYEYTNFFHGWNSNSIAMIGMHCFLMVLIPFWGCKMLSEKITFIFLGIAYTLLLNGTVSRSSTIIIILGVVIVLSKLPLYVFIKTNFRLIFILLIPLLIAILTVNVSQLSIISKLNVLSLSVTKKTFFNGRDNLWNYGFDIIKNYLIFGTGNLNYYNWHNSAITCLVGYGLTGYYLWLETIKQLLIKAKYFIDDRIVAGALAGFVFSYIQKSFELGMIAESPDILIYLILGLLLGRVNTLTKEVGT